MVNLSKINPGSFLQIIPVGLIGTLVYSEKGVLVEFIKNDGAKLDGQLTIKLEKEDILPPRIGVFNSETRIFGVLHTKERFQGTGTIPECFEETIIKDLNKHPENYHFYAIDIESPMMKFAGGVSKQTRLHTLGFDTIIGYNISQPLDTQGLQTLVNSGKYPFEYPVISGMMITNIKGETQYYPQELELHTIKKIESYVDENGYIRADIKTESGVFSTSYTDVIRYNLQPKISFVVGDGHVVHSYVHRTARVSNLIKCSVCGKNITVPTVGVISCSDPHCRSTIFNDVNHLLKTLNQELLSYEDFQKHIKSKKLMKISDIFDIEPYNQKIECTLTEIIRGIVPISVCSNNQFIDDLVLGTSSISGLTYYLHNPSALNTDLKLDSVTLSKFVAWLEDKSNVELIETIFDKENINIIDRSNKFEGAPIFRGKTICITGMFKRGTHSTITDILSSYSGEVVTQFSNKVNCVLVGDFREEDVDIVQTARSYQIPIYRESDFFKSYEIDKDLEELS